MDQKTILWIEVGVLALASLIALGLLQLCDFRLHGFIHFAHKHPIFCSKQRPGRNIIGWGIVVLIFSFIAPFTALGFLMYSIGHGRTSIGTAALYSIGFLLIFSSTNWRRNGWVVLRHNVIAATVAVIILTLFQIDAVTTDSSTLMKNNRQRALSC